MFGKLCLSVAFVLLTANYGVSANESAQIEVTVGNVPHSISLLGDEATDKAPPKVSDGIIYPTAGPQPTSSTTTKTTTTPTTTTPKPTTTTPKPTTTTPKPTTTSTPKPTTPAPPTPTPQPYNKVGIWNVTELVNNKTVACIVANMNVNIVVPYVKADPKNESIHTNASREFFVPSSANANGTCSNATQTLKLSWTESSVPLSLVFAFEKNNKSEFTLATIQALIPADKALFPDIVANSTAFKLTSLNASGPIPLHQSYLCVKGVNFTLASSAQNKNATPTAELILTHVQFQAFADATANNFESPVDCAAAPYVTPDIVPIAVGCSLAALVAVVLVAYVIGRRRSAARGYLSM